MTNASNVKEEWLQIQNGMTRILDKYPEIKQDVVDMLNQLGDRTS